MPRGSLDLLFVYGTLMPGHLRWPMLERWALEWGEAEVGGTLWDTGAGWPAARFASVVGDDLAGDAGEVDPVVPGRWVRFEPVVLHRLLGELDAMEGIGPTPDPTLDPYERIVVEVPSAGRAWAYHATWIDPRWLRIDRWADQPEA